MKEPTLGSPQNTIAVLQKYNFAFQKKFGQNFLIDTHVLDKIIRSAEITPEDMVLEIGPGIGTMTQYLACAAGKVVAVEIDRALIPILEDTLDGFDNVTVLNEDILKVDIAELAERENGGRPIKVVANLPYYITSPVIMKLLEENLPVKAVTVMVQKEAAQRLCALPGTRACGAVSAAVRFYAEPEILFPVSCGSFRPAPNVDSAVIRLQIRKEPPVEVLSRKKFFATVKAAFGQRRKTILNALTSLLALPRDRVAQACQAAGLHASMRAEQLSLQDFAALSNALFPDSYD